MTILPLPRPSARHRMLLPLLLALMIWSALSGVVLAACGTALVNITTGQDTATCGSAAVPCRTVEWARQRAQQCTTATRIFSVRGASMTLVEVVLPPSGTDDHNTPEWLRPLFPFFGFLLNPIHYTTGVVDFSR